MPISNLRDWVDRIQRENNLEWDMFQTLDKAEVQHFCRTHRPPRWHFEICCTSFCRIPFFCRNTPCYCPSIHSSFGSRGRMSCHWLCGETNNFIMSSGYPRHIPELFVQQFKLLGFQIPAKLLQSGITEWHYSLAKIQFVKTWHKVKPS